MPPSDLLDAPRKGLASVNLTLRGVFVSGNHHFGHMGMYPYKFVVHKITDVAVVSKAMKPLAEKEKAEKQWACGDRSQVAGRSVT